MSRESILIVEDEPLVGLEIREDLERLGYSIPEIVSVGEEVFDAVARCKPSLVLMDIHIEGRMDGIEAAALLKSEFDIPVIYLTAYSDRATLERAAATAPDAYLLKPFDERELQANVEMALSKARAGSGLRSGLRSSIPLVDALDDAALIADLGGVIVHANKAARELLGFGAAGDPAGMPLSRFVDSRAPLSSLPGEEGLRARSIDGGLLPVVCHIEDLLRGEGGSMGSFATFAHMSRRERRHLESSAAAINQTLQALVPGPRAGGSRFETAGFLLPCASGAGDIVDLFPLEGGRLLFYSLDVAGHGSLASLVAFSLHGMIRGLAKEDGGASASLLIERLNERYSGSEGGKPFFTIALGVVEGEGGDFVLSRAGHPPAILLPREGPPALLQTEGLAVGLVEELLVEEYRGRMGRGERLLLVSDGFIEGAFGLDLGAGLAALLAFLAERRNLPTPELEAALRRLVLDRHSSAALRDDASLLLLGLPG